MYGTKFSAEAVGYYYILLKTVKLISVGERSVVGWSVSGKMRGRNRSENVGLSNENIGSESNAPKT